MRPNRVLIVVLVVLIGAGVSLAGNDDPAGARKKLEKRGYEFTADDFLDAVGDGESKIVEHLIAGMAPDSRDERGKSALHCTAEIEDGVVTAMLIRAGADVNVIGGEGDTPLCDAVDDLDHGSVAALIAGGANVDAVCGWGKTALHIAADEGDAASLKMLLDAGAVVGEHRKGMIESAQAYPEIVALLEAAPG